MFSAARQRTAISWKLPAGSAKVCGRKPPGAPTATCGWTHLRPSTRRPAHRLGIAPALVADHHAELRSTCEALAPTPPAAGLSLLSHRAARSRHKAPTTARFLPSAPGTRPDASGDGAAQDLRSDQQQPRSCTTSSPGLVLSRQPAILAWGNDLFSVARGASGRSRGWWVPYTPFDVLFDHGVSTAGSVTEAQSATAGGRALLHADSASCDSVCSTARRRVSDSGR